MSTSCRCRLHHGGIVRCMWLTLVWPLDRKDLFSPWPLPNEAAGAEDLRESTCLPIMLRMGGSALVPEISCCSWNGFCSMGWATSAAICPSS